MAQKDAAAVDEGLDEPEALQHSAGHARSGWPLLALSFSTLGVIYGDIATSPLYSYQAVFSAAPGQQEVISAASLFFWTLTLIVLIKYVGIVLRFDDNGEGGTFALFALICRACGFTAYGPAQPVDLQATKNKVLCLLPGSIATGHCWSVQTGAGAWMRRLYRRSKAAQVSLLVVVMLATAMVIGDGVLTPSISVMSAVSGLQVATSAIQTPEVVGITCVVLLLLFSVQHLGTGKISMVFAPVVLCWLLFNAALGLYNLSTCGWIVWQAVSPHNALLAFINNGFEHGWRLLGGVLLCVTGAEAMFADLGHFNARAVSLSFCFCVYPCLVVTYMGQAAYLLDNPGAYVDPFWMSVPKPAFWPMLVVATATSIVASQALISGVFSIMRQAMMLGLFPRLRITHTDDHSEGQIYIGAINWALLVGCVAMVAGFQDTTALGHAYGVAVMSVMFITTILSSMVMVICYGINPLLVGPYTLFFVCLEGLFLSSTITKIPEGGWVTILIAVLVASIKLIWWRGSSAKGVELAAQAARDRELLQPLVHSSDGGVVNGKPGERASHAASAAALHPSAGSLAHRGLLLHAHSVDTELPSDAAALSGRGSSSAKQGCRELSVTSTPAVPGQQPLPEGQPAAPRKQLLVSKSMGALEGGAKAALAAAPAIAFGSVPLARLPGLGIVYTESTAGLPPVLCHLLINMPALFRVCVLLTIRFLPLPYVDESKRFMVRQSRQVPGMYRVVARYGYMETVAHDAAFVRQLVGVLVRYAASGGEARARKQAGVQHQPQWTVEAAGSSTLMAGQAAALAPSAPSAGGDSVVLELPELRRVAAAGSERELRTWTSMSGHAGDGAGAAAAAGNVAAGAAQPARDQSVIGRESIDRHGHYRQQRWLRRRCDPAGLSAGSAPAHSAPGGSRLPAAAAAAAAAAAGAAAEGAAAAPGVPRGAGLSASQAEEVDLLLSCYRQRPVFVVGHSRLLARRRSNPLKRVLMGAYRAIANNTQPATSAWAIPDEHLLEINLVVRV